MKSIFSVGNAVGLFDFVGDHDGSVEGSMETLGLSEGFIDRDGNDEMLGLLEGMEEPYSVGRFITGEFVGGSTGDGTGPGAGPGSTGDSIGGGSSTGDNVGVADRGSALGGTVGLGVVPVAHK